MSDVEYQKKLNDLQKYVPFLENTISKLKRETEKSREPQVTKLQSLLEILTDTRRKLKLEALKKCEEVILKLYETVEKKPAPIGLHRYMCRTPPDDKKIESEIKRLDDDYDETRDRLNSARNKLKQMELTPSSPSPPPTELINLPTIPVVIPTEQIPDTQRNLNVNMLSEVNDYTKDILHTNFNDYNHQSLNSQPNYSPSPQLWKADMLYQRRKDIVPLPVPCPNTIWSNSEIKRNQQWKPPTRDIINYSDFSPTHTYVEPETKPPIINPKNKDRLGGAKTNPLAKPPLSDQDLQALLTAESSDSSNSPKLDETMDLERLETLRQKIVCQISNLSERTEQVPVAKIPKTPTPSSAYAAKPKIRVEKVVKEQDNNFGSLLSSIDGQIMDKVKKDKKNEGKKDLIKIPFKDEKKDKHKSEKHKTKDDKTKHDEKSESDKNKIKTVVKDRSRSTSIDSKDSSSSSKKDHKRHSSHDDKSKHGKKTEKAGKDGEKTKETDKTTKDTDKSVRDGDKIKDSEKSLKHDDKAIKESDKTIKESNKVVKESDKVEKESDKTIKEGDKSGKDGDKTIKNNDKSIKTSDKSIKDGDKSVRDGDKSVKDGDKSIKNVDKSLKDGDKPMRDGDKPIKSSDKASRNVDKSSKDGSKATKDTDKSNKDSDKSTKTSDKSIKTSDKASKNDDKSSKDGHKSIKDADKSSKDSDKLSRDSDKSSRDSDKSSRDSNKSGKDSDKSSRDGDKSIRDGGKVLKDSDKSSKISDKLIKDCDKSSKNIDKSIKDGGKLIKDGDKSHKETGKSLKDSDKSHKETDKSHKDSDKSHKEADKSMKDGDKPQKVSKSISVDKSSKGSDKSSSDKSLKTVEKSAKDSDKSVKDKVSDKSKKTEPTKHSKDTKIRDKSKEDKDKGKDDKDKSKDDKDKSRVIKSKDDSKTDKITKDKPKVDRDKSKDDKDKSRDDKLKSKIDKDNSIKTKSLQNDKESSDECSKSKDKLRIAEDVDHLLRTDSFDSESDQTEEEITRLIEEKVKSFSAVSKQKTVVEAEKHEPTVFTGRISDKYPHKRKTSTDSKPEPNPADPRFHNVFLPKTPELNQIPGLGSPEPQVTKPQPTNEPTFNRFQHKQEIWIRGNEEFNKNKIFQNQFNPVNQNPINQTLNTIFSQNSNFIQAFNPNQNFQFQRFQNFDNDQYDLTKIGPIDYYDHVNDFTKKPLPHNRIPKHDSPSQFEPDFRWNGRGRFQRADPRVGDVGFKDPRGLEFRSPEQRGADYRSPDQRGPEFRTQEFRGQGVEFRGQEFRGPGPEFRGQESDVRGIGPELRGVGPELRAVGPEFRPPGPGIFRGHGPEFRGPGPEFRSQGVEFRGQGPEFRPQGPDFRPQTPEFRAQGPDFRPQGSEFRPQGPDFRPQGPDFRGHVPEFRSQEQRGSIFAGTEPRVFGGPEFRGSIFGGPDPRGVDFRPPDHPARDFRNQDPRGFRNSDQKDTDFRPHGPDFRNQDFRNPGSVFGPDFTRSDFRGQEHRSPMVDPRTPIDPRTPTEPRVDPRSPVDHPRVSNDKPPKQVTPPRDTDIRAGFRGQNTEVKVKTRQDFKEPRDFRERRNRERFNRDPRSRFRDEKERKPLPIFETKSKGFGIQNFKIPKLKRENEEKPKEEEKKEEVKSEETETDKNEIINKFLKSIIDQGNRSILCDVLEKLETLGETLPKLKYKRIKRIIESDSEDDEKEEEEDEKKGEVEVVKEEVVEDKKIEVMEEEKKPKKRKRNALEILQADIRDMFICEGVLTASGHRMCRILKEQEEKLKKDEAAKKIESRKIKKEEDEKKVEEKKKLRPTRTSPRVVLEKTDMTKYQIDEQSEDKEEVKNERPSRRRTRLDSAEKSETSRTRSTSTVGSIDSDTASIASSCVSNQETIPKRKGDTPDVPTKDIQTPDTVPDINYYLDNRNKYPCKLCTYKGKFIVNHYFTQHSEHEILISRLPPKTAETAKEESLKLNLKSITPFDEEFRIKRDRPTYICRFCSVKFKQEYPTIFYDHLTYHTGEYRYGCEYCPYKTGMRKNISAHYSGNHPGSKRITNIQPFSPSPPDFRFVFGYICDKCNYTQMNEDNVQKHIKNNHPDEQVEIIKINMSAKLLPLTGQINGKNDTETTTEELPKRTSKRTTKNKKKEEEEEEEEEEVDEVEEESKPVSKPGKRSKRIEASKAVEKPEGDKKVDEAEVIETSEPSEASEASEPTESSGRDDETESPKLVETSKESDGVESPETVETPVISSDSPTSEASEASTSETSSKESPTTSPTVLKKSPRIPQKSLRPPQKSLAARKKSLAATKKSLAATKKTPTPTKKSPEASKKPESSENSSTASEEPPETLEKSTPPPVSPSPRASSLRSSKRSPVKPDKPKVADLKVFLPSVNIDNEEKRVEEERLKKMQEVSNTIKTKRPGLNFINQLRDKLDKKMADDECMIIEDNIETIDLDNIDKVIKKDIDDFEEKIQSTVIEKIPQTESTVVPSGNIQPGSTVDNSRLTVDNTGSTVSGVNTPGTNEIQSTADGVSPQIPRVDKPGFTKLRIIGSNITELSESTVDVSAPTDSSSGSNTTGLTGSESSIIGSTVPVSTTLGSDAQETSLTGLINTESSVPATGLTISGSTVTVPGATITELSVPPVGSSATGLIVTGPVITGSSIPGSTVIPSNLGLTDQIYPNIIISNVSESTPPFIITNVTTINPNVTDTVSTDTNLQNSDVSKPWLMIENIRSLADKSESDEESIDVNNLDTTLPKDGNKRKGFSIIQRLAAKLQSNVSDVEMSNKPFLIDLGSISVTVHGTSWMVFMCHVGSCNFITKCKKAFSEHIVGGHRGFVSPCRLCDGEEMSLMGLFVHLIDVHYKDAETGGLVINDVRSLVEKESESRPLIRPRRLSGDLLSISKEEPEEFGFLKISEVKTLTQEEERKLFLNKTDIDQNSIKIKPDIDDDSVKIVKMKKDVDTYLQCLEPLKLKSLYKCPDRHCSFAENSKLEFYKHVKIHKESLQKSVCPYCHQDLGDVMNYVKHIEQKHGNCSYQCPYCLYRAYQPSYIEIHQQENHSKEPVKILKLDTYPEHRFDNFNPLELKKAVIPYVCNQGMCHHVFLLQEDFIRHKQSIHQNGYSCHFCNKTTFFTPAGLLQHYTVIHRLGMYQCKYCTYGVEHLSEMHAHYSRLHSNQPSIAIYRKFKSGSITRLQTPDNLEQVDVSKMYTKNYEVVPFETYFKKPVIETLMIDELLNDKPGDVTETDPLRIEPVRKLDSGLSGHELYRCGTIDCNFTCDTAHGFKLHLFKCDVLKEGGYYNCSHCPKKFKYPAALIDHVKVHGLLRYRCSICEHNAPVEHVILKHMKVKHKIQSCKMIPVDSKKTDVNTDLFVAVPSYNRKKVVRDGLRDSQEDNSDKNEYGPNEIENVPRQAIYSHEIKCAKCGYSTKVRTNLVRHLQAHLNSEPVPETAPINPVPCLEKNEKMFDKMLNLANSSFTNTRMGAKEKINNQDEFVIPEFIPSNKRYVCGADGCHYLTHSDNMLKCHFTTLHSDDPSYKCPHCLRELRNTPDVTVDKIMFHYRLHDSQLYKCSHCLYTHHLKNKIEKHLTEKHPDRVPYIHIIREPETETEETEEPKEPKDDKLWKCGFCRHRTNNQKDIQTHVAQNHGVKSQYKCSLCSFKCENVSNFNEHIKNHPNTEVTLVSSYYRTDSINSEKTVSSCTETDAFDTTPLWRRDKDKVKNIRGILLEETTKSPKRIPKIIETLTKQEALTKHETVAKQEAITGIKTENKTESNETATTKLEATSSKPDTSKPDVNKPNVSKTNVSKPVVSKPVVSKPDVSKPDVNKPETSKLEVVSGKSECKRSKIDNVTKNLFDDTEPKDNVTDLIKSIGDFGNSIGNKFACPFCKEYQTVFKRKFVTHMFKELKYNKYKCGICDFKAHDYNSVSIHCGESHTSEEKPSVYPLTPDAGIERWVDKVLQFQTREIKKYQETQAEKETEETAPDIKQEEVEITIELDNPVDIHPDVHPVTPKKKKSQKRSLICSLCSYSSLGLRDLNRHMLQHKKPFKCNHCSYTGVKVSSVKQHFIHKHPGMEVAYTEIQFQGDKRKLDEVDDTKPKKKKKIEEPKPEVIVDEPKIEPIKDNSTLLEILQDEVKDEEKLEYSVITPMETVLLKVMSEKDMSEMYTSYVCAFCPKKLEDLNSLKVHWLQDHDALKFKKFRYRISKSNRHPSTSYRAKYRCTICSFEATSDAIRKHHNEEHPLKKYVIENVQTLTCHVCGMIFKNYPKIKKHFIQHGSQNIYYQVVQEILDSDPINEYNVIIEETDLTEIYKCTYCSKIFDSEESLTKHHDESHKKLKQLTIPLKKYKCPDTSCGYTDNFLSKMRDHVFKHIKPLQCPYCSVNILNVSLLKNHHLNEHPNEKFLYQNNGPFFDECKRMLEAIRELNQNGDYIELSTRGEKRPASDTPKTPTKYFALDQPSTSTIKRVAKKSTASPPKQVAKKSTTPVAKQNEGFSYYGTKPVDLNDYQNVSTEANIQGNMVKFKVIGLQYILKLSPIVLVKDIKNSV